MPIIPHIPNLRLVAEAIQSVEDFSYCFKDFLDGFYVNPSIEAFTEEPPLLREKLQDDGRGDAYLAATAEHLCRENGFRVPPWCLEKSRYLNDPWFGMKSHAGRMLLLAESPAAFRVRNIFVSANALVRV